MENTDAPKPSSPSAERMRRHRERRRLGLHIVRIQLWEREIDHLVRCGLLKPEYRNYRGEIADAVHAFFDKTFPAAK